MRKMKQSCGSDLKAQTPPAHLIDQQFEGEPSGDAAAALLPVKLLDEQKKKTRGDQYGRRIEPVQRKRSGRKK
jgi:hypothetical protein